MNYKGSKVEGGSEVKLLFEGNHPLRGFIVPQGSPKVSTFPPAYVTIHDNAYELIIG